MIRGLRFHLHPRKRPEREGIGSTALHRLEEEVAALAELIDGSPVPVYLTGGICFALTRGHYTRDHKDFDLLVRTPDILAFSEFLHTKGCYIAERIASSDVTSTYELYLLRAASRSRMMDGGKTLRIVRQRPVISISRNRLDYIDLFRIDEREESIYFARHDFAIPREEFYPITAYPVGGGKEMLCPNVRHMAEMKDCRDKAALREYLWGSH